MKKRIVQLLFALLSCFLYLHVAAQNISLNDLNKIITLSNPQLSPDGKSAIFITTSRDYDNNRFNSELTLINLETSALKTLAKGNFGDVNWSPDGKQLAYISTNLRTTQINIISIVSGDTIKTIRSAMGIQRFAWSPDGTKIAFIAPQETEKTESPRFNDAFEVGSNGYLVDQTPNSSALWLVNVMDLSRKIISPDSITLATGLYLSSLSWSPDGKEIAFTGFASAYSGDSDLSKNYIVNIGDKSVRPATEHKMQETAPLFAPDGKSLAYSYPSQETTFQPIKMRCIL